MNSVITIRICSLLSLLDSACRRHPTPGNHRPRRRARHARARQVDLTRSAAPSRKARAVETELDARGGEFLQTAKRCEGAEREPSGSRSSRNRQALDVARVVGEDLDAVLGDDHGVRVAETADVALVDPRLDREHHALLDGCVVAEVEERRLVVAEPDAVADVLAPE